MIIELHKEMTWDELVEKYPDKWVFVDDDKTKPYRGLPEQCFVLDVCDFDDDYNVFLKYKDTVKHMSHYRTTPAYFTSGLILT